MIRLIGVHDVMGARMAERARFDGVWASSLEITTADGLLDDGLESAGHVLDVAERIAAATTLPLVADCQVEQNRPARLIARLDSLAAHGAAAVCLQDSLFPCPNSLLPGEHPLARIEEFAADISLARATAPAGMAVLARVQALVAGAGRDEALRRAHAYAA
ncbi:MAG TPA: isocitrate lyase/phosphoenolpyruvate mutase family protein, partial [Verrucomicrobiae bacterium]|nr:isocitrate lyase/phosphoenolpyruvate mutase family protein [Verrucomicrobiae bacterium]